MTEGGRGTKISLAKHVFICFKTSSIPIISWIKAYRINICEVMQSSQFPRLFLNFITTSLTLSQLIVRQIIWENVAASLAAVCVSKEESTAASSCGSDSSGGVRGEEANRDKWCPLLASALHFKGRNPAEINKHKILHFIIISSEDQVIPVTCRCLIATVSTYMTVKGSGWKVHLERFRVSLNMETAET